MTGESTTMERKKGKASRSAWWENLIIVFMDILVESFPVARLRSAFSAYGRVTDTFIPNLGHRRGKCFGFVLFWEIKEALSAVDSLNGSSLEEEESW